jgi:hypothetical protein
VIAFYYILTREEVLTYRGLVLAEYV